MHAQKIGEDRTCSSEDMLAFAHGYARFSASLRGRGLYVIFRLLIIKLLVYKQGGSVAEWLACWTQAQKGPGSNRSRDAVGWQS